MKEDKKDLTGKKNVKKFKKFMKENKKELNEWLKQYVDLFNRCGEETKEGSIQLAFAGSVLVSMLKSMKEMPQKEKLILIGKIEDEIKKQ